MISIIIPLYNSENYILDTIYSCLVQTYKEIEIIIVDDCSTDNSVQKIKENISSKKVRIYYNDANLGFIRTVNKGISYANGEYVLVLGNDDILYSNHIEEMIKCFDNNQYSFVYCQSELIDNLGNIIGKSKNVNRMKLKDLAVRNTINSCGLIMKKEDLCKVGGYPFIKEFPNYGEWLLWISLVNLNGCIFCSSVKSQYRIHESNLTKTFMNKNNLNINKKYNLFCMRQAYKLFSLTRTDKFYCILKRIEYLLKINFHVLFNKIGSIKWR